MDGEFSADIDKRCDCPKAVYELEDYSTRPVNYVRTARKDVIGVLMQTLLQKSSRNISVEILGKPVPDADYGN